MKNFSYSTEGTGAYLHDYGMDAWTNAVLYMGMYDCRVWRWSIYDGRKRNI